MDGQTDGIAVASTELAMRAMQCCKNVYGNAVPTQKIWERRSHVFLLHYTPVDGDPAPSPKKGAEASPNFWPRILWLNGWMDQDGSWHGGRPQH